MWFVQRRSGVIVGVYRNPQPQEDGTYLTDPDPVADDDAEVNAYLKGVDTAIVSMQNALETAKRNKSAALSDLKRSINLGASQSDINSALLALLQE